MKVTDDGHIQCDECGGSGKTPESDFYCRACNGTGGRLPRTTDIMATLSKIMKKLDIDPDL